MFRGEPDEVQIVVIEELGGAIGTRGPYECGNRLDSQAGFTSAVAKGGFCPAALGDLVLQHGVGRRELSRPLPDTFVQISGESLLQGQNTRLLEGHRRFIDSDLDQEGLGVSGEVRPVRAGDHRSDLPENPERDSGEAERGVAEAQLGMWQPGRRSGRGPAIERVGELLGSEQALERRSDPDQFQRGDAIRLALPDQDEGEFEHPDERIRQGFENLRRLGAGPYRGQTHHAHEVIQAAAQSRELVCAGGRPLHLTPPD